ncbi:unnamed protein product [Calypogeia fissa]
MLLILLVCHQYQESTMVEALLPACGPIYDVVTPCFESTTGGKLHPMMSNVSEQCCKSIKSFRFPGCFCVALVEEIGRTIDERSAIAALSLPASCGRPLPRGFNCTGFSP